MSQFNRWRNRTKLRGIPYQLIVVLSLGFSLWLIIYGIIPSLLTAWSDLATRTPLGNGRLVPIVISADHLSSQEKSLIKENPQSVPAHRVKPSLELLGIGQKLTQEGEETRFVIGLLPNLAEQVLRSGTKMSFRVEAPSFELLTQELIYSERGQKLRTEIDQAQDRMVSSWSQLWPELKKHLQDQLQDQELFSRLIKDELFLGHLQQAFLVEVSARVNLDELGQTLGESQALADLGGLAFKHVKVGAVVKSLFGGAVQGLKSGGREIGEKIDQEAKAGTMIPDLGYCSLKIASVLMPRSIGGLLGHLLETESSSICTATIKSAKGVLVESAKQGGIDLAKQSLDSLLKEQEASGEAAVGVVSIVNAQLKPKVLLERFWLAISQDDALITHLKNTYGSEGLARITGALRAVSSSEAFSQRVGELSGEIKQIAQRGLSALLLDQSGKGPNPLLLAVIQEQLSGQMRPKIHITPGDGDKLSPGHIFKHHEGAH